MSSTGNKPDKSGVSAWKSPRLVKSDDGPATLSPADIELRQDVYEQAFQEGFDNGKDLGMQEAADQLQVVRTLLTSLSRPFDDQDQQLVETLALLAGRMAKAIVSRELRLDPESLAAMVRDTVAALNASQQEVFIYLNPKNAPLVRELLSGEAQGQSWRIIDDPHVALDACKVRCKDSIIDADLDTRIDLIINQLLDNEPAGNKQ